METSVFILNHWHWWILAIILIGLEVFAPTTIFLWFGISAGITGLFSFILPDSSWEAQCIFFSILSVVSIVGSRYYLKKNPIKTDQPKLNQRGAQYVGRKFNLEKAIENGVGKIRVDDTYWRVECKTDCDITHKVNIIGVEGASLIAEVIE